MASRPGLLTEWPWHRLGNFKYLVIAPWVIQSFYLLATKEMKDVSIPYLLIFPSLLLRMLHNQIWISISRWQTARSPHRIVDKSIEFEQILFNGILFYVGFHLIPSTFQMSMWRTDGVILNILFHAGPVEFLYYWFHRALHHHFLYSRYHSHHHASIVTEPITSVTHPFAEHIVYSMLFAIPVLAAAYTGTISMIQLVGYVFCIDFMNNMGHCNFELVPKWLFSIFPPLKYLIYTPSFHSLHHTQFRTNYSLFMPFYDYLYNTMDKLTDEVYEISLKGKTETIDVVHLTHPTTLQSIYHLRLGIASLASKPYKSKWYDLMMLPVAWMSMVLTWFYSSSFIVERNKLKNIKMQTWVMPRYNFQYGLSWEKEIINNLIEKSILQAETNGVKVKELNRSGELYLQKYPKLKLRIVDGSSLAIAVILNNIPKGTKQILLKGNISKVARTVIQSLCNKGIKVVMTNKHDYYMLEPLMFGTAQGHLILSNNCMPQVWLVGDGMDDVEQGKAQNGTIFIPYSYFPPKKVRNDCLYYSTPAMKIPNELQNVHSCENWLPRRVMSAWRVAGIIHGLEGWDANECGENVLHVDRIWMAALRHGFLPLLHE
ncbi:hypothetical protein IEQ34_013250 [Dendrobium chrysotoxum]|uniref:aldehyde oxygenase (deformylating) n=1 Tax=Dendrobium chrysotoxum TaxID=161865 RepID=A0AAV7G7V3_DENCH|nr:hypothetical protein IEQ34_013250 [Dendrobium chrysotoxum]